MSTLPPSKEFRCDAEWVDVLAPKQSSNDLNKSTAPWGFLKPLHGDHPILYFPRPHDIYNIVLSDSTNNLKVVAGDDGSNPLVQRTTIAPARWNFSYRTSDSGTSTYTMVHDSQRVKFWDHTFIFNDTLNFIQGAFLTYQYVDGSSTFFGGSGSVRKVALRLDPARQFALKIVQSVRKQEDDELNPQPHRHEISVMMALDHDHICRFHQAFATSSRDLHLVMEYAELGTLGDRVKSHVHFITGVEPLPAEVFAGSAILQLCSAVQYIHSKGIIHRDIKPDNILLTSMSPLTLKVADFGIATREKRPKMHCGTRSYMAPEIMLCPSYDNRVDTYAVGAVLLDILVAMYNCEDPVTAWYNALTHVADGDDIVQLEKDRNTCLRTDVDLQNADSRALALARGLLHPKPSRRIALKVALKNSWLREMESQCELSFQGLMPTQSVDEFAGEATPQAPSESAVPATVTPGSVLRDVGTATAREGDLTILPLIRVDENVRELQLKRRSPRIIRLAREKADPDWLYHSGLERGRPRD